jgi:hypothetical protein
VAQIFYKRPATIGPSPGTTNANTGTAPVIAAQERQRILQLFSEALGLYDTPDMQNVLGQILGRASGQSAPFTPNVVNSMLGANSDGANGAFASERDLIRQSMANQGLSGSGGETAAILAAIGRQGMNVRAGRREITSRAQLENFGAAERAQQQAVEFLKAKAAHKSGIMTGEAGYRSSLREEIPEPPQQQTIAGGNAFGPPMAAGVFDQRAWDRMLQQSFAENQDYFGNPVGSAGYGQTPIPGSPAAGNTGYGSTGYVPPSAPPPPRSGAGQDDWRSGFVDIGKQVADAIGGGW